MPTPVVGEQCESAKQKTFYSRGPRSFPCSATSQRNFKHQGQFEGSLLYCPPSEGYVFNTCEKKTHRNSNAPSESSVFPCSIARFSLSTRPLDCNRHFLAAWSVGRGRKVLMGRGLRFQKMSACQYERKYPTNTRKKRKRVSEECKKQTRLPHNFKLGFLRYS